MTGDKSVLAVILTLFTILTWTPTTTMAAEYILEEGFAASYASKVEPFWESGKSTTITGQPYKENQQVNISVRYFLQDDARANVFLVHGFRNYKEIFRETAYDFYIRGYNVFTFDLRGHGRSSRMSENRRYVYFDSYDNQAEDMLTIIRRFGDNSLKNFAYTYSMGGLVTALVIQKDPTILTAVTMVSPFFQFDESPAYTLLVKVATGVLTFLGLGDELAFGQEGPNTEPKSLHESSTSSQPRRKMIIDYKFDPKNEEEVNIKGATNNWALQSILAIEKALDKERAAKVKTKVLLFQGELDTVVLAPGQVQYCEVTPDCELVVALGAKHAIYNETDSIRQKHFNKTFSFFESFL